MTHKLISEKVADLIVNASLILGIYAINSPEYWWQWLVETLLLITFGLYNWFHGYNEWLVSDEQ